MPNYCSCDLYIKGPLKDQQNLINSIKNEDSCFDFNKIIPYPEHFAKADEESHKFKDYLKTLSSEEYSKYMETHEYPKDGYNQGGYEWCCGNWGTKWNAIEPILKINKTSIKYYFETAWSPPYPIIAQLSRMYPKLTFTLKYYESGMAFKGILSVKNSIMIKHEESDYKGCRGG